MLKSIRLLWPVLALAGAYWLSAILGKMLHSPPVYATAVWPPAGIALGAALVWGRQSYLGIALGAFLANSHFTSLNALTLTDVLLTSGIALGAVGQAALIAFLICRWAGYPSYFNQPKHIARFLILTGPVGCCLNATLGNAFLIVSGISTLSGLTINWLTWWVGDTMGALIFTPLMLIAFGQPRTAWRPRWLTVALPLVLCFALAIGIFIRVRATDQERKGNEFIGLVNVAVNSIESGLQDFSVIIFAMKGLYNASGFTDCDELKSFTDILLEHKNGFQALELAKIVPQDKRKSFEQEASLCDGSESGIKEINSGGTLVPAGEREAYLPVVFIDPIETNRPALGFDLYSERLRRETIQKARETGHLTVTPALRLVQERENQLSVLMVAPLYRQGSDALSPEGRKANFTGSVLGILHINGAVTHWLEKLGGQRKLLHLHIQENNPSGNGAVLFADNGYTPEGKLFQQREITIGERTWQVSISGDLSDFGHGWFTWFVLAAGMLFNGVLGGFLLLLTGKTMSMESLIAERTLDLANTNKRLREEIGERSRTETALRESESRFRTLANAAPVLIWLAGTDKLCHWFNQVWLDFTGRTMAQEMGNGWAEGVHPDDFERCLDYYCSHFDRREAFSMEYRLRRHDGEYRWILDTGAPLVDGNGDFAGYIGSCIDVTERKRIEQETARLALVAEKSTTAIVITDPQGYIEWANPAFTLLTGYDLNEVIGLKPGNFLQGPETDPNKIEYMRDRIARKLGFDIEILNYAKIGQPYWVHLKVDPVFDSQGCLTNFIGVQTDISERIANEKAIQKLNRSYQYLLAAASEVSIIATDTNGLITLFNRGAERMLGYTAAELIGRKTPAMFHLATEIESRGQELSAELGHPVTGFQVFTAIPDIRGQEVGEWTYVCKDGLSIWVSLVVTQIKSEEGIATGYLGIAQNITERKAAELATHRAKLAADKANQAKSEFLANMSHEIRTPMNGILGMIELLRGTDLTPNQRELADTASYSASALMEIINDILDFSKIEAGKFRLDCIDFDVSELCENVSSLLAVTAQAKGLEFNCFVQPDMHSEVRGDPTRLRQVLVNLIGNAIKFTLAGEVFVEATALAQDELSIQILFNVRDTGIGMKAEEVNRLFMPFEQAEHGSTRRFGGTGLGLSISKSLVEMMGGEISVESTPNLGSSFKFTVKLEKIRMHIEHPKKMNLAGRYVLVADDNRTNLAILGNFLKNWGVEMAVSDNGRDALATLKAAQSHGRPFDLAILDQVMPDFNGLDVIRAITEDPTIGKTPCILLLPTNMPGEFGKLDAGQLVSLSKPVRQSQLYDAMVSLLHDKPGEPLPAQEITSQSVLPQYTGKRVLLVEDNPVNQRVAIKMLERFGLTPRVANNGEEAQQELECHEFDLVFMDCQIPIMDGYTVTKFHREREAKLGLPRTPIVALTANAIYGDAAKSIAVGMDDHLTKPLSFKELERALTQWLAEPTRTAKPEHDQANEVNMSEEPLWDYQAALRQAMGDVELLEETKALFIGEVARLTQALGTAEDPQPPKAIYNAAHSIKGSSLHFHANKVVALCIEVETRAKAENIESADPLIVRLKHELERLVDALGQGPG